MYRVSNPFEPVLGFLGTAEPSLKSRKRFKGGFSFHNIRTFSISGTFFSQKKVPYTFVKSLNQNFFTWPTNAPYIENQLWLSSEWTPTELLKLTYIFWNSRFWVQKGTCKLVLAMLRKQIKNPIITSPIAIGNHYYPIKSLPTITEVLLPLIIVVALSIIKPHL